MEIIKRGQLPQNQIAKAECRNCKTLIKFKHSEGKLIYDQRDGDFVTVACPVCGSDINVSVNLFIKG